MSSILLGKIQALPGISPPMQGAGVGNISPSGNLANQLQGLDIPQDTRFSDLLGQFVNSVEGLGKSAETRTDSFLQGHEIDLHEVMIAGEEAGIAFDLLLEVRNRLVEAYKEIIRMPL